MAQTLSEIKSCLAAYGLQPKRRLGQNFLHDGNQMARVVDQAGIVPGDRVLEVGAGTGGLSQLLLDAQAQLVAVEIDVDLEPILLQALSPYGSRATWVIGDVLAGKHVINPVIAKALHTSWDPAGGSVATKGCLCPFKLVANLPYSIASPLLVNLLTQVIGSFQMSDAVVMVQREVADRLCACSGNKHWSAIGVMVQAMATVQRVAVVGPNCFWPRPKVDSALVHIQRREKPLTNCPEALGAIVAQLFGKRRKQLGTILGRTRQLPEGIDPQVRPEQLSIAQFVILSDWINPPKSS